MNIYVFVRYCSDDDDNNLNCHNTGDLHNGSVPMRNIEKFCRIHSAYQHNLNAQDNLNLYSGSVLENNTASGCYYSDDSQH